MDGIKENISLKKLAELENLSIRTVHVCEGGYLYDIKAILNYFWKKNDFLHLRNCGQKSNTELIELCEKYKDFTLKPEETTPKNPIEDLINSLTVRQKKILNNLINSQLANLSVRSFNCIDKYSNSNYSIKGLYEVLVNPKFNYRNLRNVGRQSEDELIIFFNNIREQLELIQLFENDDELTIELFNTYLRKVFCLNPNEIVQIWNNYNSQNGLPIFKTIDTLTLNGHLFKEKEQDIFKRGFKFWTDTEPETLEDIAASIGLTRERTRQIRKKLLDEIDSVFTFLRGLEFDALNLYGIDVDSENIVIDENLIDEIQQKESVKYNSIFVTKILSLLLNKTHCLVGNLESCAFNSAKPKGIAYRWNSIYLISKKIGNILDIESLAIDIDRRLSNRIDEDYSFHFETYLVSFLKEGFESDSFLVTQIAEHIIFNEFEITIDTFDQITFRRNTKKQVIEYVYDILKEKNEPLDIYRIYDILISKHPNVTKSAEALRGSCQRDPKLIYFGRSSTYGLREWEQNKTVKGGTMHDIAEEFLIQFETPKHIDEIKKYVSQYRPSVTSKNLLYNLKSAENRRFLFFKNYHIGLIGKEYNDEFIRNNNTKIVRRTWEENFELLSEFAYDNNRLPFSSGNEEEQKLYRFMNVQLNKASKNKVEKSKIDKINELVEKYGYTKRARRNPKKLDSSYIELAHFIKLNKRLPNARDEDERNLYHFYYRQTKQYENGELTPEHENMYLETKELIQTIYGNR